MTAIRSTPKIRPDHLDRQAFVYVRQSTLFQVRENTASTARQYDLVQHAQDLGWSKAAITVLDHSWSSHAVPVTDTDAVPICSVPVARNCGSL